MGFSCGIVGLPNVGKSTLFNALTRSQVDASNYPFCTIEPNHAVVPVPDKRLDTLAKLSSSKKKLNTAVSFTDIAGLVRGASKGEGLGNQFLANIRQTDAIIEVLRVFDDADIVRDGPVSPFDDLQIIHTELILADIAAAEKRKEQLQKQLRSQNSKEIAGKLEVLEKCLAHLESEQLLNRLDYSDLEWEIGIRECCFLTVKPLLIVANIGESQIGKGAENEALKETAAYCREMGYPLLELCGRIEHEVSLLGEEESAEYLSLVGLECSGLERLILAGYELLGLSTFFTTGETESRAWTVRSGAKAPEAAGVIHTDFQKGFIKAEVISYDDFTALGSWSACRDKGKLRIEGKEYEVQDGDVCLFRFNV